MVEFICLQCKKVMEVEDKNHAPAKCTECGSDDIAPVTFQEGPTMPKGSFALGLISLVLGPLTGLPAVVLGIMALYMNKTPRKKAIIGIVAGSVGTVGISVALVFMFIHFYRATYVAECQLNLSRIALAQLTDKNPGKTTTQPATMPAGWCIEVAATRPAGATMPASATTATKPAESTIIVAAASKPTSTSAASTAPATMPTTAPYSYETTWPWTLEELVKKAPMAFEACPMSRSRYFYVPPTTTAPATAIVISDTADVHPGRCVLRVNGCVECLTEEQFKAELKKDYNSLFAYMLEYSLKNKGNKAKEPTSQPTTQPATQPTTQSTTKPTTQTTTKSSTQKS